MAMNELNFAEICRCCKLTETGMISIFAELPIYPPVKEMLNTIASLNAVENDGLPSLVCTLCLNNIQDTYTFIMQLIRTDAQLWQILVERRVKVEALPQDVIHSTVDDLDESMENVSHGSADNNSKSSKISDLDVKSEMEEANIFQSHQEQLIGVLPLTAKTITKEESSGNLNQAANFHEIVYPLSEDMEESVEEPEKQGKTPSELADESRYKCKLCSFTCTQMYRLKQHLLTHSKNKPFICSKCNGTFCRKDYMLRHWRKCSTEITKRVHCGRPGENPSKHWISLTLQDLEDAEKLKEYYTVTGMQRDAVERETTSSSDTKQSVFNCKLCAYSSPCKRYLKGHMMTHAKDRFTCSKCKGTFKRKSYMLRHWLKCNGERSRNARRKETLTVPNNEIDSLEVHIAEDQEVDDAYQNIASIKDEPNLDAVEDVEDVVIEEICPKLETKRRKKTLTVYKCKLCAHSVRNSLICIKAHLMRHYKNRERQLFPCSKCKREYSAHNSMLSHKRTCMVNRKFGLIARLKKKMTLDVLNNPSTLREYYTETIEEVRPRKKTSNDVKRQNKTMFKCKLCVYACSRMFQLKKHLITHYKDKPFTCSKCKTPYSRKSYKHHWRNCNGKDAEICKRNYSGTSSDEQNNDGDSLGVQTAEDRGDDVEIAEKWQHLRDCNGGVILEDLEDSEKMKEYYSVTEIGVKCENDDKN